MTKSETQMVSFAFQPNINITTYFKNLIVELHVLCVFNTHVKFYVNRILFTM